MYPGFQLCDIPAQILSLGCVPTVAGCKVFRHMAVYRLEALINQGIPRFTHWRVPFPF